MEKATIWLYIVGAVAIAVLGNYLAATWASRDMKFSLVFVALVLISPLVFISFGLVTSKIGVAVGSGTIDALLSISTVIMGLVIFHEWSKLSNFQYIGLGFVLCGIILLQFSLKPHV